MHQGSGDASRDRRSGRNNNGKPFGYGPQHPNWVGGRPLNEKGYVKIKTKENYNKYEHRVVVERMLREPLCADYVFSGDGRVRGKIPDGMTVHHQDHCRTHNCIPNLMLLEDVIHRALSKARYKWVREHYVEWEEWQRRERERDSEPEPEPDIPEWVTTDNADGQSGEMVE